MEILMIEVPNDPKHEAFSTVLSIRIAMVLAGTGKSADDKVLMLKLATVIGLESGDAEVDDPLHADWQLYSLDQKTQDPIKAVMIPAWLHKGLLAVDPHFDPASVDPMAWTDKLAATLATMPPFFNNTETQLMASILINAANQCPPELMQWIRDALAVKSKLIAKM